MLIKRNNNYLFYRIALTHVLTFLACIIGKLNIVAILSVWFFTAILPNFIFSFTKNLKAIDIKEDKLYLIFNKYFKEIAEVYSYTDLIFTYKNEIGGKGSVSMEFRVYKMKNEKSLISIGGTFDGWTDDKILNIIEELKNKGITIIE